MATGTPAIEEAVERACAELGYTTIKEKQKEVILNFVSGRDVFAALPTGYGRSLCYCRFHFASNGVNICVRAWSERSLVFLHANPRDLNLLSVA